MRAAFTDPQGRLLVRLAPYLVPLAMFIAACAGPWSTANTLLLVSLSFAIFNLVGMLPFRQLKSRSVELTCGPGWVDVKKAGSRTQRIVTRSVIGASTARTSRGVLLTLGHRERSQPIHIEVETEADAEKIRHALGIGHGGFGTIAWRTIGDSTAKAAFVGRFLLFGFAMLISVLGWTSSHEAAAITAVFGMMIAMIAGPLSLVGLMPRTIDPSVVMTAAGVQLRTPVGWFNTPYDHVSAVERLGAWLRFYVHPTHPPIAVTTSSILFGGGLGADEERALRAQILSAAGRARGLGASKTDVTGRVEVLRRNGENARDWLVRLDMAGQLMASSSGYRGLTLDTDDLWTILEDPEAEADLRAAAARILRHSSEPQTKVRIDATLAAVRDEHAERKLRIAVRDDLDSASQELASLDNEEAARTMRYAPPAR